MPNTPFAHTIAAIATPFHPDLRVDFEQLVLHARWLFENGGDGIVLFGTTGEAVSLTVDERMHTLDKLIAAGIAADRIVVGTGCCAVADTVKLTQHAGQSRVAGALVVPPYFYKGVSDAGVIRYYNCVIAACGAALPPLYLYHIPQVSGVGVSLDVIADLLDRHGDRIRGYKDSSGQWKNTQAILARFPSLDVYVGSESLLLENLRAGGAGCVSAGVNVQPALVRRVVENWQATDAGEFLATADAVRKTLEKWGPLVPAIKSVLARIHGHGDWTITRPPLEPLPMLAAESLLTELRALGLNQL